mmetsp:Transcript_55/g.123  ORF Transcript_55/g.123 Transcript_55/m.123 type:complete len:206 (-) Transcript_55:25-642(-)
MTYFFPQSKQMPYQVPCELLLVPATGEACASSRYFQRASLISSAPSSTRRQILSGRVGATLVGLQAHSTTRSTRPRCTAVLGLVRRLQDFHLAHFLPSRAEFSSRVRAHPRRASRASRRHQATSSTSARALSTRSRVPSCLRRIRATRFCTSPRVPRMRISSRRRCSLETVCRTARWRARAGTASPRTSSTGAATAPIKNKNKRA